MMKLIHARYNGYHNRIDITTFNGYLLRIDCNRAEHGLKVTSNSQCALNALAIDEPLEYARLYLDQEMQALVDAEDGFGSVVMILLEPLQVLDWTCKGYFDKI